VLAAALALGAAVLAPTAGAAAAKRPNVVVIMTDDQTLSSLSAMQNTRTLLGDRGTTFDNYLISLSQCCPSRATFLTGQYAHNHGVLGNKAPIGGFDKLDHSNTLAVWLQRSGYFTAMIGKYLNGYGEKPGTHKVIPPGWNEWFVPLGNGVYRYYDYTVNENKTIVRYGSDPGSYETDVFTRKAVDAIGRRAGSDQPFFLWLAYVAPHAAGRTLGADSPPPNAIGMPIPAPSDLGAFASSALPTPPSFNEADVSDKPALIRKLPLLGQQQIDTIRQAYQAQLASLLDVDRGVAAVVQALAQAGKLDNTLIVFSSDNGYLNGEHRVAQGKLVPYEPSIRVPLIMRGPGIPAGQHLEQLVTNADLAPTLAAVANARPERVVDGRSLLPLFRDPTLEWGRDVLLERGPESNHPEQVFVALRTPRFKYVEYANGDKELYDLAKDPGELQNQVANPAYAKIRNELAGRLASLRRCAGSSCRAGPRLQLKLTATAPALCLRRRIVAALRGSDATGLRRVDVLIGGRVVAHASRAPFRVPLTRALLGKRSAVQVRARVVLDDGREATYDRTVPACK
jgi:arylsulfatase A-like enzyme